MSIKVAPERMEPENIVVHYQDMMHGENGRKRYECILLAYFNCFRISTKEVNGIVLIVFSSPTQTSKVEFFVNLTNSGGAS